MELDISRATVSNYYCVFSKIPNIIYYIQSIDFPSITQNIITYPQPQFSQSYAAGTHHDVEELTITALADETLKNYFSLVYWLRENEKKVHFSETESECSIVFLNNAKKPIFTTTFHNCIPSMVSSFSLNIQSGDAYTFYFTLRCKDYDIKYNDGWFPQLN